MTEQCPKTCGRCSSVVQQATTQMATTAMATTSSPCFDKVGANGASDCPRLAYLCNDANYYKLMTEQCPKTCGRCSSASGGAGTPLTTAAPSNSCVDKTKADGTSDCPKDAYLCNNPAYYNLMTQQCPKTCGRC
uniref:ShKT domain-containing protein n=1 Tax=Panagrolaimus sp. PS1159 TaxID=55785 RepID=A0AC35FCM8_9BILA